MYGKCTKKAVIHKKKRTSNEAKKLSTLSRFNPTSFTPFLKELKQFI